MIASDIVDMLDGVNEFTKDIIVRKLRPEFTKAIHAVNARLAADGLTRENISPVPSLTMHAFRLCPLNTVKIVVLGQDPFIKPGEAMGLSFSVPRGVKIPPSLANIYKCLSHCGLLHSEPTHGDLSNWARQGILMINAAFTTKFGKSNYNAGDWANYTDKLLQEISALPQPIIFIFLGGFAQGKEMFIDKRKHTVLKWGHPSPINNENKTENPKHFKNCDVFTRANDHLVGRGLAPINYDVINYAAVYVHPAAPIVHFSMFDIITNDITNEFQEIRFVNDSDPAPITLDTLWIFTDGGSIANGKPNCVGSWGYYITDGCNCASAYAIVEPVDIPGEKFKSSNNRGELTAILRALQFVELQLLKKIQDFSFTKITIVSDSEYSINCIDKWVPRWIANSAANADKKNMDLLVAVRKSLDQIRKQYVTEFKHMRSHRDEPADSESEAWFYWKCNDIVDKYCNIALGRNIHNVHKVKPKRGKK